MYQHIKKIFISLLGLLCVFYVQAQNQDIRFTLLESNGNEALIRVDFPAYQTIPVDVNGTTMYHLNMEHAYPILETGSPELLSTAVSLIVPENSRPTAEIISSDYTTVTDFELAPSKGRITRDTDPASISYMKSAVYFQDRFLKDNFVSVGETYQLRDYNGVALKFFPFAYNPVQKELKVYSNITVKVRYNSERSFKRLSKVSKTFNNIYKNHFLNYTTAKSTPIEEDGDILIIAPDDFCAAMQPYAEWKIQNGYATEIVPLSVVGNSTTAVKSYIANYYESHNLVYVLIVGDDNQFPVTYMNNNISDNYYVEIAGDDVYPDAILGKISAENVGHVETQVAKFIQYEQSPVETNHFPVYLGIASSEGPGDNNEYDYQHIRNIGNKLSSYTYTSGYELFEGSQGNLDASGNPTAANVSTALNAGVGIINYCGHGDVTNWVTTNFNNTNVSNLTNYNKLPFIISTACLNGNYVGRTCFAEAWIRATKEGQLTGAVSTLMATISQPWDEPMCAQDQMIDLLTGANNTAQKHTFGSIVFNGLITMLDNYYDYEVSRTWILFGDPTLLVRTAVPQTLSVSYDSEIVYGLATTTVTSPVEGARVVLTKGDEIISQSTIANGMAILGIDNTIMVNDTLHLLVSAPNYLPFEGNILIVPNNGPFVVCEEFIFHDNRNNDGLADFGETVTVDAQLKNIGTVTAHTITTRISTEDPYLTFSDDTYNYATLNAESSSTYAAAYAFQVAQNVPANHNAIVDLEISYNDTITYHFTKTIALHAPQFEVSPIVVNDQEQGNGNGRVDLNETVELSVTITNDGNSDAYAGTVNISNPDGSLDQISYSSAIPALPAGESHTLTFSAHAQATEPTAAQILLHFATNHDYTCDKEITLKIGSVIEDWESGGFTNLEWVNDSVNPWIITTSSPYEGTYAARSGSIGNSTSTSLYITNTNTVDDTLSFYYKVSSEENYDMFTFSMDDEVIETWSGNLAWAKYSMLVPAGTHTFKWEYTKDYLMSAGSDMAAIDNISFPCMSRNSDIEERIMATSVTVMPNPTADVCQIHLSGIENLDAPVCQLYNMMGQLLHQQRLDATSTTLSLNGYAKGLYLLKIADGKNILNTVKIVKE